MGDRIELQSALEAVLGSSNVYFQPPPSLRLEYPAIVYHLDSARATHADNKTYSWTKRYQVTFIGRDPDSLVPDQIAHLPMTRFTRYFAADNLHHYVYDVYF